MLLLISEALILLDIFITIGEASVDVIPDFPGYVLLLIFFIIRRRRGSCGLLPSLLCLPAAFFSFFAHAGIKNELFVVLVYFIPSLCTLPLGIWAYDCVCREALEKRFGHDEESLMRYRAILIWCLAFILICRLGSVVTQLFNTVYVALYIARCIVALYMLYREKTIIFYKLP